MGNFHYRARDNKGALVRGQVAADDAKSAKKKVSAMGLTVLSAQESPLLEFAAKLKPLFRASVSNEDLIVFSRQTQIVYTVGIPILHGMQLILDQTTNPSMQVAIAEMIKDISAGHPLHETLSKHDHIFDPVYVNLIRVGESTGDLGAMLERAAQLIEQRAAQEQKVKSATFYPKIVITFFTVVLLVVVYLILPRMKSFFENMGGELPLITRIVMGVSDAFVTHWYLVFALAAAAAWSYKTVLSNPRWRYEYDKFLLKLPILGLLLQQIEVNTFCIILEILLKSGITIVEAFEYVERSAGNTAFARDISVCAQQIERGGTLSKGLADAENFPNIIKGLIGMGEEGGKLPDVLNQISHYYTVQIDYKLDNLSKLIEPILLVFIFGLVLILALAVYLPMWKMSSMLKH